MTLADDEVSKFETKVMTKRRELDAFRIRYNIVSLERGEPGLPRCATADAASLPKRSSHCEGTMLTDGCRLPMFGRDDPGLANLEQRARTTRRIEEMQRSLPRLLAGTEGGVVARASRSSSGDRAQREASPQAALVEAQDEVASARAVVASRARSSRAARKSGSSRRGSTNSSRGKTN